MTDIIVTVIGIAIVIAGIVWGILFECRPAYKPDENDTSDTDENNQ